VPIGGLDSATFDTLAEDVPMFIMLLYPGSTTRPSPCAIN